ncbi:MAG: hypothetical protein WD928_17995 [Gammaproteobacteria bacterium]
MPASRKLGAEDARRLAAAATTVIVAKGKKVDRYTTGGKPADEVIDAMLGPTGNLRAPTLVSGKTVIVGFNDDSYGALFDA